ncbi:MAG: hypothetical protein IKX49_02255 [Clostridia bacterium]|nr:hypothetical protein [Clostridia bacterium]
MPKKIFAVFLAILTVCALLCSCDMAAGHGDQSDAGTLSDDPVVGDGTSYSDFMTVMTEIKGYGDRIAETGLSVQSEYYYSFAGASVSAFRFAVEYILWLKGEGETFESFTSGSRYTGWERIAEINYSSPYPSYFEGLILEVQGMTEECFDPYASAAIMPMFPEEGLDFYYLKSMSVEKLYGLRDSLRSLEDSIYSAYTPALTGHEWDRLFFDAEYLIALSYQSVQAEDYASALYYAKQALKADPFYATAWHNAVMCALYAEETELAGGYIDEGLALFPEDGQLLEFKQMMLDIAERMEAGE